MNGYSFNEFKKNTPKNGIIDRIQIVRYPNKSGYIEPHQHHPGNIRIILNVYLSKKGKDFSSGGVMFYKKALRLKSRKYKVNKGDALIFFSTMRHSVDEIIVKKNNTNSKNKFKSGRWWIWII